MDYAVIGGDARMGCLAELLKRGISSLNPICLKKSAMYFISSDPGLSSPMYHGSAL